VSQLAEPASAEWRCCKLNYSDILVETRAELRMVRLNRPEALNSLRKQTLQELHSALLDASRIGEVKAVILTGAGDRAFSAGGDIKEMEKMGVREGRAFALLAHGILDEIEGMDKPVVSAVNGLALGAGCDLATACDLCVASENARFGMPSLKVGVTTPFGGMSRLMWRVGLSRAKQMIYTGDLLDAQGALAAGLVNKVFEDARLLDGAMETAREVAGKAPIAFRLAKRLLQRNANEWMRRADELEVNYYSKCFGTSDQKEGALAFRMKREPNFKGE
jgi:enoyl-CoA hydratase